MSNRFILAVVVQSLRFIPVPVQKSKEVERFVLPDQEEFVGKNTLNFPKALLMKKIKTSQANILTNASVPFLESMKAELEKVGSVQEKYKVLVFEVAERFFRSPLSSARHSCFFVRNTRSLFVFFKLK